MRVLIFHGYLLRGTGSNVYNAHLAPALVRLGHEVHLFSQDLRARDLPWVDAVGEWRDGELSIEAVREPVRCTVYRPPIGRVLPVYVPDQYEGFDARRFLDLTDAELERYVEANAAAVREVATGAGADLALANHALMGPAVLARALGGEVPYAVKIHGSALEYTVRPDPDRFVPYAREGLDPARGVLVGSRHTAEVLWDLVGGDGLPERTRLGPPGVDVEAFRPRPRPETAAAIDALAGRLAQAAEAGWGADAGAAAALRALDPARDRLVGYVGKLIVSKGVDLLLAAWPLVCAAVPEARLVVVGFGTYREGLERLVAALADGDLSAAREIAARGRELEGGPPGELRHLAAFLDGLDGDRRARFLAAAPHAAARVHFTGRLEHADLPELLPALEAQVVPSTFPEAFGMVAAEAACCGALPLSAAHSGLAEVSAALAPALDADLRPLLAFGRGRGAVDEIAATLIRWLTLAPERRAEARGRLAELARGRFGWEGVARGVLAAAQGRLDELPVPGAAEVPEPLSLRPRSG